MTVTDSAGNLAFTTGVPYGTNRLLMGLVFCVGLILVVVGGAELFTGNNLIVMAWANGKVTGTALLHNWAIVYLGNFIGSLGTVVLMFLTRQYTFGGSTVGIMALRIGVAKIERAWLSASDRSRGAGKCIGVHGCLAHLGFLTWTAFFARNLLPVTIGNIIIGGAILVAAVYWVIYLRPGHVKG
ncbi:MAG TPA: formate/nitrite transporter family protein [Anaerolineales bacterium]|nr:formate/nitrite transporter family protein [Anaerolineales bacterium]